MVGCQSFKIYTSFITIFGDMALLYKFLLALGLFYCKVIASKLDSDQQFIQTDGPASVSTKPNVVFILTDDQDLHLDSLSYMPHLKNHLLDQGTFYRRHYCTIALCCPSRVSLWTGRAAHNTNVTDVNPPYGL